MGCKPLPRAGEERDADSGGTGVMDPNQNVTRQSRGRLETDAAGLIRAAEAAADSNVAALKLPPKPLSG